MKYFFVKASMLIICIAAVLGGFLHFLYPPPDIKFSDNNINQLCEVLEKNNVIIDKNLIDFSKRKVFHCNMSNCFSYKENTAQTFLGAVPEIKDNTYYHTGSRVSFTENKISFSPDTPQYGNILSNINADNAVKKTEKICKALGVDTNGCNFGISSGSDRVTVSVMPNIHNLPVFNDSLIFEMSQKGLHTVSGLCYEDSEPYEPHFASAMPDALMKFMNECADRTTRTVITDIKLGYLLIDTTNDTSDIKPVWRITTQNSAVYYIDA